MKKTIIISSIFALLLSSLAFAAGAGDYSKYGGIMFKKGDYKKALAYFSQAAKLDPRNPAYYTAISACYAKMGKKAEAKKYAGYAKTLSTHGAGAPAAAGGKIKATFFTGLSTASMGAINDSINTLNALAIAGGATGTKQNLGTAFMIGAQGGYSFLNGLYVGPRLEYVAVLSAASVYAQTGGTVSLSYGGSIIDMLVGGSYYFPLHGIPLTLSGDLYLGYGAAGANMVFSVISGPPFPTSMTENASYGGGAFAADICLGADYSISQSFSAGLSLGYRMASVSKMTADKDVVVNGMIAIHKGDVMKDLINNAVLPADFSGLIINLKASMAF